MVVGPGPTQLHMDDMIPRLLVMHGLRGNRSFGTSVLIKGESVPYYYWPADEFWNSNKLSQCLVVAVGLCGQIFSMGSMIGKNRQF